MQVDYTLDLALPLAEASQLDKFLLKYSLLDLY